MRIVVVNPNTTASMTETIRLAAAAAASPGTEVVAVTPAMGPASIESHYDEALAVPGLLDAIRRETRRRLRGGVLRRPRPGRRARAVGRVVTTLGWTAGRAWELAECYGAPRTCRNVRACEIPVVELENPESDARRVITAECARAVAEDGCDAIVLGCAGMADLCAHISAAIGVPVVDGVAAATRAVESLVALGLTTGKRGEYAAPLPKSYTGILDAFGR